MYGCYGGGGGIGWCFSGGFSLVNSLKPCFSRLFLLFVLYLTPYSVL